MASRAGRQQRHDAVRAAIARHTDAIVRGDVDSVFHHAHADVRFDLFAPPEFPWVRRAAGDQAVRDAFARNLSTIRARTRELTSVTHEGDTLVLLGLATGYFTTTDQPYRLEFVQRFQFREGRLASLTIIVAHTRSVTALSHPTRHTADDSEQHSAERSCVPRREPLA